MGIWWAGQKQIDAVGLKRLCLLQTIAGENDICFVCIRLYYLHLVCCACRRRLFFCHVGTSNTVTRQTTIGIFVMPKPANVEMTNNVSDISRRTGVSITTVSRKLARGKTEDEIIREAAEYNAKHKRRNPTPPRPKTTSHKRRREKKSPWRITRLVRPDKKVLNVTGDHGFGN